MVKKFIKKHLAKDDRLLHHSLIIFIGSFIVNVLNYVYQLLMGRLLGPADFAVMGALFALIYVVTFSFGSVQTVIMKFTSDFYSHNELGKIRSLLVKGLSRLLILSALCFALYFFMAPFIASFLKISEPTLLLWVGLYLVLTLLAPVPHGILNGMQKFYSLTFVSIVNAVLKLFFGVLLVFLGYGVFGVLLGLSLASVLGLLIAVLFLHKLFSVKSLEIGKKAIFSYTLPVFFGLTFMHLFVNIDVLLVKHLFSDVDAGNYAAASVLGKIVLFASGFLMTVMFPKVAFSSKQGKETASLLKSCLFYTAVISLGVVLMYFFVPTFIASMLFGKEYAIAPLLGLFGLSIALFSLSNVLVTYNLALHKTSFVYLLSLLLALEVVGIYLFHHSLFEVVQVLLVTNVLVLGYLLIYSKKAFGIRDLGIKEVVG